MKLFLTVKRSAAGAVIAIATALALPACEGNCPKPYTRVDDVCRVLKDGGAGDGDGATGTMRDGVMHQDAGSDTDEAMSTSVAGAGGKRPSSAERGAGSGGDDSRPNAPVAGSGSSPAAGSNGVGAGAGGSPESAGGAAGTSVPTTAACAEGAFRCIASGGTERDKCTNNQWEHGEACSAGQTCVNEGSCMTAAQTLCTPNRDYKCDGAMLQVCDADGGAFRMLSTCPSAALCNASNGTCTSAACEAGKSSCEADKLTTCNADGTAIVSTKQCQPGMCDAASGSCRICEPGKKTCDGKKAQTCRPDGLGFDMSTCPNKCIGDGSCVECSIAADCSDPGLCEERVCEPSSGTCAPRVQSDHTPCTVLALPGVCSSGTCVGCIDNSDCVSRAPFTACNTASHQCVAPARCGDGIAQPEAGEECDDGNQVNEDSCLNSCKRATCGDGFIFSVGVSSGLERCDPMAPGWSPRTCNPDCELSVYVSSENGPCPAGTEAPTWGVCSVRCSTDADCPSIPRARPPVCFDLVALKICAIFCSSDSDCPSGLYCNDGTQCNGLFSTRD